MSGAIRVITGAKYIYTLQEGERWTFYNGTIIVCHPERKPKVIDADGNIKELEPTWPR